MNENESTALDDAVKAAMTKAACVRVDSTWGPYCDFHAMLEVVTTWDTDRDECSVIGAAVRAGWAAAIDAATRRLDAAADWAMEGTGPGYGDEAYERAVNAARIAYGDARSTVHALRLPEGDQR